MTLRVLSIGSAVNESTLSLTNFPRTISQTSSLFRQSQHKRYCRQCSDVTCTKKYALTKGPKRGGGEGELMWATRSLAQPPSSSSPPQSFYVCYGPASHQSHYFLYYNGIPKFVRKRPMLTEK